MARRRRRKGVCVLWMTLETPYIGGEKGANGWMGRWMDE